MRIKTITIKTCKWSMCSQCVVFTVVIGMLMATPFVFRYGFNSCGHADAAERLKLWESKSVLYTVLCCYCSWYGILEQ